MLLKTIIAAYGNSVSGRHGEPGSDPCFETLLNRTDSVDDIIRFRREVLDDFSVCKPFFLDHNAAEFLDTFMDQMNDPSENFVRDIDLPHDVIWIEYDEYFLHQMRNKKGIRPTTDLAYTGLAGVLYDNRDPAHLKVQKFLKTSAGPLVDALTSTVFDKDAQGRLGSSASRSTPNEHALRIMVTGLGMNEASLRAAYENDAERGFETLMMGYALFTLLNSRSSDIEMTPADVFSDKELKTARKFGKTHVTSAPKTHMTVSLTEPAKRYIQQMRDDHVEATALGDRKPTVDHAVREHVRRYKSGKISIVRAHRRGSEPDMRPTRVTATLPEPDYDMCP